jgi:hypothetical protein
MDRMKLAILFLLISVGAILPQEISHRTGAKLIHKTDPQYTKEALDAKVQGVVVLSFVVAVDGMPSEIKVVRGLGSGLDEKPSNVSSSGASLPQRAMASRYRRR